MSDLIDLFLTYKQANEGKSARTAQIYGLALGRLVAFLQGKDLREASGDELLVFTGTWLHKMGLKPESRRTHIAAVREFYAWMKGRGYTRHNPAESLAYPKIPRKLPGVITLANAEKLMWAPDFSTFEGVRDGAILGVLVGCGLRANGVASLNVSNVFQDEIEGRLRTFIKPMEKGKKERLLPVPVEADLMLRLYLEHPALQEIDRSLEGGDKVLFVSTMNRTCPAHEYIGERRRMNRRAILDIVKRHGRRVGIPEDQIHPHAIRHLYGTELAEGEVDLIVRQKLLGHADPKTTEIYDHMAKRRLTRAVDQANPMAKMRTPVSDLLNRLNGKDT